MKEILKKFINQAGTNYERLEDVMDDLCKEKFTGQYVQPDNDYSLLETGQSAYFHIESKNLELLKEVIENNKLSVSLDEPLYVVDPTNYAKTLRSIDVNSDYALKENEVFVIEQDPLTSIYDVVNGLIVRLAKKYGEEINVLVEIDDADLTANFKVSPNGEVTNTLKISKAVEEIDIEDYLYIIKMLSEIYDTSDNLDKAEILELPMYGKIIMNEDSNQMV